MTSWMIALFFGLGRKPKVFPKLNCFLLAIRVHTPRSEPTHKTRYCGFGPSDKYLLEPGFKNSAHPGQLYEGSSALNQDKLVEFLSKQA